MTKDEPIDLNKYYFSEKRLHSNHFHPPNQFSSLSAFAEADGTRDSLNHPTSNPPTFAGGFFISIKS